MKITTYFLLVTSMLLSIASAHAESSFQLAKVATWNMKWLGTNSGNQLDETENVPKYAEVIRSTDAHLFALQEIGATHSVNGMPRCYYLDLIVAELNKTTRHKWAYKLDATNKNQRLAYLYNKNVWSLSDAESVWPGSSYRSARRPFVVKATLNSNQFDMSLINVHFKAFPDEKSSKKRAENIRELSVWISENDSLDEDTLLVGDTNIYPTDGDIELPLRSAGLIPLDDDEKTAIHKGKLSQRFDRFYISMGLRHEFNAAAVAFGRGIVVDVIKKDSQGYLDNFDSKISDHFPVVLGLATGTE